MLCASSHKRLTAAEADGGGALARVLHVFLGHACARFERGVWLFQDRSPGRGLHWSSCIEQWHHGKHPEFTVRDEAEVGDRILPSLCFSLQQPERAGKLGAGNAGNAGAAVRAGRREAWKTSGTALQEAKASAPTELSASHGGAQLLMMILSASSPGIFVVKANAIPAGTCESRGRRDLPEFGGVGVAEAVPSWMTFSRPCPGAAFNVDLAMRSHERFVLEAPRAFLFCLRSSKQAEISHEAVEGLRSLPSFSENSNSGSLDRDALTAGVPPLPWAGFRPHGTGAGISFMTFPESFEVLLRIGAVSSKACGETLKLSEQPEVENRPRSSSEDGHEEFCDVLQLSKQPEGENRSWTLFSGSLHAVPDWKSERDTWDLVPSRWLFALNMAKCTGRLLVGAWEILPGPTYRWVNFSGVLLQFGHFGKHNSLAASVRVDPQSRLIGPHALPSAAGPSGCNGRESERER
ncbi:hypothetical protein AK812_SmicGene43639 [Symbiodinium microadriaticum]|uniref:Uncharacterized protein n=1 Tax=Symbiodinium microadriaticum TaxID=2951 RepID=A0A1Q9C0K4_SYMMI|nr:hypothetical protein AK812_SmicGene43639 [Symbiodinium microadriaticum]